MFEADATISRGRGAPSLLCISSQSEGTTLTAEDRYYDFFIVPTQGYYGIAARHTPDEPLSTGQRAGVLLRRSPNRIRAECLGSPDGPTKLVLHINGQRLLEYVDGKGYETFVAVGLAVYSFEDATAARFDNASVGEP